MTTYTPTRTDLSALDQQIVLALVTLRQARAATLGRSSPRNLAVETRAEANLNALLDYRHSTQRHRTR
jgi:hypothetical protein